MKKIFGIVLSAALLAGCAKEMSEKVALDFTPKDFTASLDATRTALGTDGHKVLWSGGDRIGVFYKGKQVLVEYNLFGNGGSSTGYFTAAAGEGYTKNTEADNYYAVYPFDQKATQDGGVLTVTLPSEQYSSVTGFDPEAAVMAAVSNVESLDFQNTEGLLKLVLKHGIDGATNVNVSSIVLTSASHPLSGTATIDMKGDATAKVASTGSKSVTLNCKNPDPIAIYADKDTPFYIVVPETDFEADDLMVSVIFKVDSGAEMSTSFTVTQAFNVVKNKITTITKTIDVSAASITGRIIFDSSMPDALKYMFVPGKEVFGVSNVGGKTLRLVVDSVSDDNTASFRVADGSYSPSVTDGDIIFSFTAGAGGIEQKYSATASVSDSDKSLSIDFYSQTAVLCVSNWGGAASGKYIKAIEVSGPDAMTIDGVPTPSNNFYRIFDATTNQIYLGIQNSNENPVSKIVLIDANDSAYYFALNPTVFNAGNCFYENKCEFKKAPTILYSVSPSANDGSFRHNDGAINADGGYATNGVHLYHFTLLRLPDGKNPGEMVWNPGLWDGHFCSIPTQEDGEITFAFRPGSATNITIDGGGVSLAPNASDQTEALTMAQSTLVSSPVKVNADGVVNVTLFTNNALVRICNWKMFDKDGNSVTREGTKYAKSISRVRLRGYSSIRQSENGEYSNYSDYLYGNYKITVAKDHISRTEELALGSHTGEPEYQNGIILARILPNVDVPVMCGAADGWGDVWVTVPTVKWGWPRIVNVITSVEIKDDAGIWYSCTLNKGWAADVSTGLNCVLKLDGTSFYQVN